MDSDQRLTVFEEILGQEESWSLNRLAYHAQRLLAGYDVKGKRILDIGCGRGTFSVLFALAGAKWVVGLDSGGAGGDNRALVALPDRIQRLGLVNCEFLPLPFTQGLFDVQVFDLLFLHNSINHLHEVTSDLREDLAARQVYASLFCEMFRATEPGGLIVIADCARSNLFAPFVRRGLRHPIPGLAAIEWDKHQEPEVWKELLGAAGFSHFSLDWYVPAPLKRFGRLINNRLVSYYTFSHFVIRARRPEATT